VFIFIILLLLSIFSRYYDIIIFFDLLHHLNKLFTLFDNTWFLLLFIFHYFIIIFLITHCNLNFILEFLHNIFLEVLKDLQLFLISLNWLLFKDNLCIV